MGFRTALYGTDLMGRINPQILDLRGHVLGRRLLRRTTIVGLWLLNRRLSVHALWGRHVLVRHWRLLIARDRGRSV